MTDKCTRCDGCGKIADTDDGEPWTQWMGLPVDSAAAVIMGIVKPIPCPVCGGTGNASHLNPDALRDLYMACRFAVGKLADGLYSEQEVDQSVARLEAAMMKATA